MTGKNTSRALKKQILSIFGQGNSASAIKQIQSFPPEQVIGPLFSHFYQGDENIRWQAITAMGAVVAGMAEAGNIEGARVVMRRLMWNLNDESGGIGWGSPEAMGEITARNARLADEFHRILTSYVWEDGNFLEHEILQRGVLWGVGRLAHVRPDLVRYTAPWLLPFTDSPDPFHRGIAIWALEPLGDAEAFKAAGRLADDRNRIKIFLDGELISVTVGELARKEYPRRP